jgi:hypothetical protein
LFELAESDVNRLLQKIKNKQFRLFAQGDNGRIYEIEGEDKLFKITDESSEYEVAEIIVGRHSQFSTFIPIHYVDSKNMYIASKANPLSLALQNDLDSFIKNYKQFAYNEGGEVSIFDFLDADGARNANEVLVNFLRALQQDIQRTGIEDLDLDLDFKTDNVMLWNGNLVLIDW